MKEINIFWNSASEFNSFPNRKKDDNYWGKIKELETQIERLEKYFMRLKQHQLSHFSNETSKK
jgi:hypothetical protein